MVTAARFLNSALQVSSFSEIAGWEADDHAAALRTFRAASGVPPPKTRELGVDGAALQRLANLATLADAEKPDAARRFFEQHFAPHRVVAQGFVTGYYEPELTASLAPTPGFPVPLYRRPGDLVELAEAERPAGWDPEMRFARRTASGLFPFFDRAAIESGALAGRGLELAWLADPVEAFFVHIQGSARLRLTDGGTLRVSFDGKSGHPYTSIGRLAVERGLLSRDEADKDGLEAWLKRNREAGLALMRENRSYIFFRATSQAEGEGPIGAAGVPLSPGRSLAVDRTFHTFHTPIWVKAPGVDDGSGGDATFRRLMIAQDTGSAILGPARGDIFFGSGDRAGSIAGRVRHRAEMVVLVPQL
jgi:membrane-bound lytic murein transglycosylase A